MGFDDVGCVMIRAMIMSLNWLRMNHRVGQLCVRKDKSRSAIGWSCIGQSSAGSGKLGEVMAG